ncbi:MAG: BrnT family toxin [Spirochaetia bacterium]
MDFEWDPLKDRENQQKHGVSFAEAVRAWLDPRRVTRADRRHNSRREQRYFLLG